MNNNNTQPRQLRKVSQKYTRQSQLAMVMHNLAKNKGAMAGLILIAVIALVAIFADFLYDYDDVVIKVNPERADLVETRVIDGVKYIMIRADSGVELNGLNVEINE